MQSAEQQLYSAIDELLVEQDDHLVLPMTHLNDSIKKLFEDNTRFITKIQDRIIRKIDRDSTKHLDTMDIALTRVLGALDNWQQEVHYLLTQVASKGGIVKPGDPLESALMTDLAQAPQLGLGATMILEISRLTPFLADLIEVLREIRDRLPGTPVRFVGEPAAEYDPQAVVDDDTAQDDAEVTTKPRQMPVA